MRVVFIDSKQDSVTNIFFELKKLALSKKK